MTTIKLYPQKYYRSYYIVNTNDIDEVIAEMKSRIRPISWSFYYGNIRHELEEKGRTIVDQHAGMGNFYEIIYDQS